MSSYAVCAATLASDCGREGEFDLCFLREEPPNGEALPLPWESGVFTCFPRSGR